MVSSRRRRRPGSRPGRKPTEQAPSQDPGPDPVHAGHTPGRRALLYGCFAASGAAGLALEIVWSKYLSFLLGNSIYGVSAVVAAFLGGLGLGAALGGRLTARAREPLLWYAGLEGIVALFALASPLAYVAAKPLFAALYQAFLGQQTLFLMVRFLILFVGLLLPTVAMGATLPLVVSDFERRDPRGASPAVARLYALNTAGAVLGVAAAGFWLIPKLGLGRAAAIAAGIDLAVAAAIYIARPGVPPARVPVSSKGGEGARPRGRAAIGREAGRARSGGIPLAARWILPIVVVSGFTAILYEICWTRILAVPFGGMVYAFSAILVVYLGGIALGSGTATWVLRRVSSPLTLFGALQILLAGAVILGSHSFADLPHWQASAIARAGPSTVRLLALDTAMAARIILPATFVLGALFPAAVAVERKRRGEAGAAVGSIYAANTVGSIAGALASAVVLIPTIGTLPLILSAAGLNATLGILALLSGEGPSWPRRAAATVALASAVGVALFALPTWNPERMSLGLVRLLRSHWFGGESLTHRLIDQVGRSTELERLLFYKEGRVASVAVIETGGQRALLINGKADATTGEGADMTQQIMVGQLPLLLNPKARDVCVIGYGSGVTTNSVLSHPVREVLTIELEGAVLEAAPFFKADAGEPLRDPRSRVMVEDAGTYLRSTARSFDAIISEPSNLWIAGMADLFTRDFYEDAARRLRPGGVFCQWVHLYQTSRGTLDTIFRTLGTAFRYGHVFYVDQSEDLIIVASPDAALDLDVGTLSSTIADEAVRRDLARIGIRSLADLLRTYRGRLDRIAGDRSGGPINTDDNGWLEHRAPLDLMAVRSTEPLLPWTTQVGVDLAASLTGDAGGRIAVLEESIRGAEAGGNPDAAAGLRAALVRLGAESPGP